MAHFAKLNSNNVVLAVYRIDNSDLLDGTGSTVEHEDLGVAKCKELFENDMDKETYTWVQASYSGSFRVVYPGVNYIYDKDRDAFLPPKPEGLDSWIFNEEIWDWTAPVPYPTEGAKDADGNLIESYYWNEEEQQWVEDGYTHGHELTVVDGEEVWVDKRAEALAAINED